MSCVKPCNLDNRQGTTTHMRPDTDPLLLAKTVASVESVWRSVQACTEAFSDLTAAFSILTPQEMSDLITGRSNNEALAHMLSDYEEETFILAKKRAIDEPLSGDEELFVGTRLWTLYLRFVQVHGRMGALVQMSFKKREYRDWREDKPTLDLLVAAVGQECVDTAKADPTGGVHIMTNQLRANILKEARKVTHPPG